MRELIRKGQLEEAVQLAITITTSTNMHDAAIAINADYRKYKLDKAMGVLSNDNEGLKYSQIVARLLNLMYEFEVLQATQIKQCFLELKSELQSQNTKEVAPTIAVTAEIASIGTDNHDNSQVKLNWYKKIRDFLARASDVESKEFKAISGVKKGVQVVQEIAKSYNKVAPWIGLPSVPKVFL